VHVYVVCVCVRVGVWVGVYTKHRAKQNTYTGLHKIARCILLQ